MKTISPIQKITLIIDFIIIALCTFGVYNITQKAGLPFSLKNENSKLIILQTSATDYNLSSGDQILRIENLILKSLEEVEVLLDGKSVGEIISLEIQRADKKYDVKLKTINYYSQFYTAVAIVVGLMFVIVAVFVLIRCEKKETANILHWALMFTAMIILMTWGSYSKPIPFLGLVTRFGFHLGYVFAPVFFLLFITIFPKRIAFNTKRLSQSIFTMSFSLFIALNYTFFLYIESRDLVQMRTYITLFDISSIFIILIALSAITLFIHTYITSDMETERKKIRWILLGFILGPINYVIFWVIPSRLWNNPILPEPIVLLLVSFVPITFGISIIKYRILDIDIIFRRGIVYSVVISFLLVIYLSIIALFAHLINNTQSLSIIAAISVALIFQPLKTKVRRIVDKKFFRVEYNYRESVKSFLNEIKDFYNPELLISRSLEFINNIIPINKIGFYYYNNEKFILSKITNSDPNFEFHVESFEEEQLDYSLFPLAKREEIELEANTQQLPFSLEAIGASLLYIIKSSNEFPHGIIAIGRKKSETKFTVEDLDLIAVIVARLSILLDKIKLQEEVIREHLEKERLEELNKLKSYFVSSVSHDLKTPITSIKMFAEKLKSYPELSQEKIFGYLNIIEGESNRLTRLIDNVLDFAKIEAGVKKYTFTQANIVQVIKNVLDIMEYQITMKNFKVKTLFEEENILIYIDEDAVSEAIINILSNSLKYYTKEKIIEIRVSQDKGNTIIEIEDRGKGICKEDIKNIFEPFFRSQQQKIDKSEGTGLGLAIVRHIIDAHDGKIDVESSLGNGTKIKLHFPKRCKNEKNITNRR